MPLRPPSPGPRPTVADVPLIPRRRKRTGSTSTSATASTSSSRGRGARRGSASVSRGTSGRPSTRSRSSAMTAAPAPAPPPASKIRRSSAVEEYFDGSPSPLLEDSFDSVADEYLPMFSPLARAPSLPLDRQSIASAASSSQQSITGERRYTAAEKGKGRAVVEPIEIEDDEGDESFQVVGVQKRPIATHGVLDEDEDDEADMDLEEDHEDGEEAVPEDNLISAYTCPVCFSEPTRPMITPCGHILCAKCLHGSMRAAVARQVNPFPAFQPRGRGRGRGRSIASRGRGSARARGARGTVTHGALPQPAQWTKELLQDALYEHKRRLAEKELDGMMDDPLVTIDLLGEKDEIKVEEVLRGLWKLDSGWVVEGECPVCRKPIPGGFGPPNSGVGGVTPIHVKLHQPSARSTWR